MSKSKIRKDTFLESLRDSATDGRYELTAERIETATIAMCEANPHKFRHIIKKAEQVLYEEIKKC